MKQDRDLKDAKILNGLEEQFLRDWRESRLTLLKDDLTFDTVAMSKLVQ